MINIEQLFKNMDIDLEKGDFIEKYPETALEEYSNYVKLEEKEFKRLNDGFSNDTIDELIHRQSRAHKRDSISYVLETLSSCSERLENVKYEDFDNDRDPLGIFENFKLEEICLMADTLSDEITEAINKSFLKKTENGGLKSRL